MSQTTISAGGQSIGVAGQIYDSGPHDIVSGVNEENTQMPFGYGVRDGSARDFYKLASGFSGVLPIAGINVWSANHQPAFTAPNGQVNGDMGSSGLLQYASLQVGRKGRYLVPVEAAPTIGDGAWCRGVATGNLGVGVWRSATRGAAGPLGASYHVDCSKQAVFRTTSFTASDGSTLVAVVEVDFTNSAV